MNPNELLKAMTLEEKAILLTGKKNWYFNGIPRLGIRDFVVGDGPHGLRAYSNLEEQNGYPQKRQPATMFPCASAMASTWNPDLIYQVGSTIGKECNHYKVDVILAPGINGKRSPLAGRNFEYYSEDPVLTTEMGVAFVHGVQSQGVGTSIKHFILNEQESSRRFISSKVDERTFRELYAFPFEQIIKRANPLTIMPSYNKIDGIYACHNKNLLTDLLRKEWNFKGITISDWGAVQNKRDSVLAGLDIEMPVSEWKDQFIQDVLNGLYDENMINQTCLRILYAYDWMLQNRNYGQKTDFVENHEVARSVAREAICLLKNKDQVLPLSKKQSIVVLGEFAQKPRIGGGGSSDLLPFLVENPLDEIKSYVKPTYFSEYQLTEEMKKTLSESERCLIFTGTTEQIESEGFDRSNLELPKEQLDFIAEVTKIHHHVIVINSSGAAINVEPFIDKIDGFIQSFFLGSASGKPIAEILFGDINPSGKLSETFPINVKNTSVYPYFPGKGVETIYSEGLFTGYRFFDTYQIPTRFPFGFGLSYTNFKYSNITLTEEKVSGEFKVQLHVDVTNTGSLSGKETVMLFVGYPKKSYISPAKVLKQFKKVFIMPQETKTVIFNLTRSDFQTYISEKKSFLVEAGTYQIFIGENIDLIHDMKYLDISSDDVCHNQKSLDFPANLWLEEEPERSKLIELQEKYRKLHWWEKEEPLERILKRIANENNMDLDGYDEMLSFLGIIN